MTPESLILNTILIQRDSIYDLKKDINLSWTDIEVLSFGFKQKVFTVYQLQLHFKHTNIQQLRRSASKLTIAGYLELPSKGVKGQPAFYWISNKGKQVLENYINGLINVC